MKEVFNTEDKHNFTVHHLLLIAVFIILYVINNFYYGFFFIFPVLIFFIFKLNIKNTFKILYPLFIIYILGAVSCFFNEDIPYDYLSLRDHYYFLKPICYILIGSIIFSYFNDLKLIIKALLISNLLIVLYFIYPVYLSPQSIFNVSVQNRSAVSLDDASTLGLIMFVCSSILLKLKWPILSKKILWFMLINGMIAIYVSNARIILIQAFLVIPFLFFQNKNFYRISFILLSIMITLMIFQGELLHSLTSSGYDIMDTSTVWSKFGHSFNELLVRQYDDMSRINSNWRGFEAWLGLNKFSEGTMSQNIFGQGFGTVIYCDIFGSKLNLLPITHNSFITILLKSGILGYVLMFIFCFNIFKYTKNNNINELKSEQKFSNILLIYFPFFVIFITLTIHGIYKQQQNILVLVLLGIIASYAIKNHTNKKSKETDK